MVTREKNNLWFPYHSMYYSLPILLSHPNDFLCGMIGSSAILQLKRIKYLFSGNRYITGHITTPSCPAVIVLGSEMMRALRATRSPSRKLSFSAQMYQSPEQQSNILPLFFYFLLVTPPFSCFFLIQSYIFFP